MRTCDSRQSLYDMTVEYDVTAEQVHHVPSTNTHAHTQCAEDRNHFLSACAIFSPLSDILALWSPHCHEFESVNFTG